MTHPTTGHTVKRFDGEMTQLQQLVLEMGALVLDQIQRALTALEDEDPVAARAVVVRDKLVNDLDMRLDEEVVKLLARRQPMAGDLRAIMAVAKSVTDLERIGDQTRRIALLVERLYEGGGPNPSQQILRDIHVLAGLGAGMLRKVLDAFQSLDVHKAVEVIREDARLEGEFQSALRRLSTFVMEDSRTVGQYVEVVLALRALERIGGHAKNIAGYVVYLCTGRDVRHANLDTIAEDILATN